MAEPKTTGEAIQVIRAALYDLARRPGWDPRRGATQPDIINYCIARHWPVPIKSFEKAFAQLDKVGAAKAAHPWGVVGEGTVAETRYLLAAAGDLEEEQKRRPWAKKVLDELRRPRTFVEFAFAVLGFALGLLSGWILHGGT